MGSLAAQQAEKDINKAGRSIKPHAVFVKIIDRKSSNDVAYVFQYNDYLNLKYAVNRFAKRSMYNKIHRRYMNSVNKEVPHKHSNQIYSLIENSRSKEILVSKGGKPKYVAVSPKEAKIIFSIVDMSRSKSVKSHQRLMQRKISVDRVNFVDLLGKRKSKLEAER